MHEDVERLVGLDCAKALAYVNEKIIKEVLASSKMQELSYSFMDCSMTKEIHEFCKHYSEDEFTQLLLRTARTKMQEHRYSFMDCSLTKEIHEFCKPYFEDEFTQFSMVTFTAHVATSRHFAKVLGSCNACFDRHRLCEYGYVTVT